MYMKKITDKFVFIYSGYRFGTDLDLSKAQKLNPPQKKTKRSKKTATHTSFKTKNNFNKTFIKHHMTE